MSTMIAAFVLLLVIVLLMSVGYIVQKRSISGSCGGIGNLGIDKVCDCDDPCDKKKSLEESVEKKRRQLESNRII